MAVFQHKPAFAAPYTGTNSLVPASENSRTLTATLYAGVRLWRGAEVYFDPEMALGVPFSGLKGLGGFTNGEIARTSGPNPVFYRARLFLRQTWNLGEADQTVESGLNQLAGSVAARRIVLTAGNVSALDIFDANKYSHEPRRSFLNWSLMTQGAWDYPADARGYTWGAALEYITPDWAIRAGRFMEPKESNGLSLNRRIMRSYGDVVELETGYAIGEQKGRLKLLAFRNQAVMGSFTDAIAVGSATGAVPDVSRVRVSNDKRGAAVNIEHELARDVGAFARGSAHDGRTETFAFTEIDRSLSGGVVVGGGRWGRADDQLGVALAVNGLSSAHRTYLARGGLGFFLGDGTLSYKPEYVFESFYSMKLLKNAWLSIDYQRLTNPGYNADRGPANFYGIRLHLESG
ncbi:MAG TPA: carbohydrate porin [Burkholderiales bacterium]|nr:carbohydrate porin [Burkholderiales bacterium]